MVAVEMGGEVDVTVEHVARMLAPSSTVALVQVGALHAERLGEGGARAAQPLLQTKAFPLLVWQLGAMQESNQPKAAMQVARALLSLATCGADFQDAVLGVGGVPMLVAAVNWASSMDVGTVAAAAISNLVASNQKVKNKLRVEGGIEALIRLMRRACDEGDGFAIGAAAAALRNAVTNSIENQAEVTARDGIPVCVEAISSYASNADCTVQLLSLLNNLFLDNPDAKDRMVEHQGLQALMQLINLYSHDANQPTITATTRTMWSLLVDHPSTQVSFVAAGGLLQAVNVMRSTPRSFPSYINLLGVLCCLAPTPEVSRSLCSSDVLQLVISALSPAEDARPIEMAMNAVLHMVKASADPLRDFCRANGLVEALLTLLRYLEPEDRLCLDALDALLEMVDRNIDAQIQLCDAGGIGLLVEMLARAFRPNGCTHPTIPRLVWIMFHLADNLESALLLRHCVAAKLLVRVTMSGLHNPDWPTAPAILPAVAALGRLAVQSKAIREDVLDCQAVTGCVRLLQAGVESKLCDICITTLSSLAEGTLGQTLIRKEGGLEYFCRILLEGNADAEPQVALDAVTAIGHMTLRHKENQTSMRMVGAFEALTTMLTTVARSSSGSQNLLIASLVAIFNMVDDNPENQAYVSACGGVPILGDILKTSMISPKELTDYLRKRAAKGAPPRLGISRSMSPSILAGTWPRGLVPPPCRVKQAAPRELPDGSPEPLSLRPSRNISFSSNPDVPLETLVVPEAISLELPGRLALDCLSLISRAEANSDAIRDAGIIPLFVELLGGGQDNATKKTAAISLAHLAGFGTENQNIMSDAGALERLVDTLDTRYQDVVDSECRKWVCVALSQVVCGNPKTQEKLGRNGIEAVISVLRFIPEVDIRSMAAEALRNLADHELNQTLIVTLNGVQALLEAIRQNADQTLTVNCLSGLHKLALNSAQCRFISARSGGPKVLIDLIIGSVDTEGNGKLAEVGCEVLTALTVEEEYKVQAKNVGGISELIRVMRLPPSGVVPCKAALTVAELCAGCKENRIEFRKCLGMRPLVRLLNAGPDSPVTIAGSSLICVLAMERENKDVLRNCQVFDALVALIRAGPESPASVSALRAVQGMCQEHYLNQNAAREVGILAELVSYIKCGHMHAAAVGAAAGAMASLCSAGNATNVAAFRSMGGMEVLLEYVHGGLGPAEGSDMAALLAVVTADYPGLKPHAIKLDDLLSPLIELLESGSEEEAMGQALNALASMAYKREAYKQAIVAAGAIPHVVKALTNSADNPRSSVSKHGARLIDCLAADEHHKNKFAIKEAAGLEPMLKLLRQAEEPALQLATASAVGHICYGDPSTAPVLVRGHGITALCKMIRPGHDQLVTAAALWALRIACATPDVVLDLIAAEQGIKHCLRLLTESGSSNTATNAAFLLSQFAKVDKKYHQEIFDRNGAETIISILRFTLHEYTFKLHLVRTLSGLSRGLPGKQEIRRVGGISALVIVLERDCMEANGMDADITIATTDVLWRLSFDHTNVLRMKDTNLVGLLVKLVTASSNKQAAFNALCTITVMSEVPTCQQDVIDAGGLRCLVTCVNCVSRFKMNVTAAVALRHFCGDARHRDLIRSAGAFKSLTALMNGTDMEATLEALITCVRLLKPEPIHSALLVKAGAVQAIKGMWESKPMTPELMLPAQELLRMMQEHWEGKRLMMQTGADRLLEVDVMALKSTISGRKLNKVSLETAVNISQGNPPSAFSAKQAYETVEEEEEEEEESKGEQEAA